MIKEQFYTLWTTGRGLYVLLGLLFIGIFVSPLSITGSFISNNLVEFVFALILISGIFTLPCPTILRVGLLLIAFLAVLTRMLEQFDVNFTIANKILAAIMLVTFSILIIKHFLLGKVILRDRIVAAVAVYLIFGVFFARLYEIVHLLNAAAFSSNEPINPFSFVYFSFVTLMTIGYGDIVPLSVDARSLSIFEGVLGQLYLVILISSLVSEFSALTLKQETR